MPTHKGSSSKTISNLSVSLIESAFLLLVERSLPVYRRNIDRQRPPVAGKENVIAAAAIVQRKETRLLNQLIEMTVCRDSIVHPKFYTVTHSWDADLNDRSLKAKLAPGAILRDKTLIHKMKRRNFTKLLKLPLVPTWVSYVDSVACILVLHRLLNLLDWQYRNPYAWVGGITAYEKQTKELFTGWNWQSSYPRELSDWVTAFFQTLSLQHQSYVKGRLGRHIEPYLRKKQHTFPVRKYVRGSLDEIFRLPNTPRPAFLSKPPPWKM